MAKTMAPAGTPLLPPERCPVVEIRLLLKFASKRRARGQGGARRPPPRRGFVGRSSAGSSLSYPYRSARHRPCIDTCRTVLRARMRRSSPTDHLNNPKHLRRPDGFYRRTPNRRSKVWPGGETYNTVRGSAGRSRQDLHSPPRHLPIGEKRACGVSKAKCCGWAGLHLVPSDSRPLIDPLLILPFPLVKRAALLVD